MSRPRPRRPRLRKRDGTTTRRLTQKKIAARFTAPQFSSADQGKLSAPNDLVRGANAVRAAPSGQQPSDTRGARRPNGPSPTHDRGRERLLTPAPRQRRRGAAVY